MHSFIEDILAGTADAPCLLDADGRCLHTYASLQQAAADRARALKTSGQGSGILPIASENSPDFIINVLAALDSGISVLPGCSQPLDFRHPTSLPGPCFLRWTSGSIASPKLAAIPLSAIIERVRLARRAMPLGPGDGVLWFMPMADHFLVSILHYLASGASIVLADSPTRLLSRPLEQVTTLYGLPHPLLEFLHRLENPALLPGIKRVYSGGEAIPRHLNRMLEDRFQMPCTPFWGLIEVGVPAIGRPDTSGHPGCIGSTVEGYRIEPRPSTQADLPELHVSGPGLFAGYLEDNRFIPRPEEPWPTGDSGYQTTSGEWVLSGRVRQSYEWNGRRWLAQELEALTLAHPSVLACRLCLRRLPEVRLEYQAAEPLDPETLLDHCRAHTDLRLDGLQVEPVPTIPRTRTGKVDRLG